MAVRFSNSGQYYSSTSAVPTTWTITCWVNLNTDRNTVSGIASVSGSFINSIATGSDGTTLAVRDSTSGVVGSLAMTPNTWYKVAASVTLGTPSSSVTFYGADAASALTSTTGSVGPVGTASTLYIGTSATGVTTNWFNGRIAAFKQYSVVLTTAEIINELSCYMPYRTANLSRWHPFISAETADYSGAARTLSGGSGATTESGPPIPWRWGCRQLVTPWDPTSVVWYAIYDDTTGDLISTGTDLPGVGLYYKTYLGAQPDLSLYVWDTAARDFVLRAGDVQVDRVSDLVADASLASAWASLSGSDSQAMQSKIGQMLGPYRQRYTFQDANLE